MLDHRLDLKTCLAAMLLAGPGLCCSAQTPAPANPPVFSKPADSGILPPESSESLPRDNSPGKGFHGFDSGPPLPLPPPSSDLNPALQKELNQRAEWTLQTPEEIMGLQTPEEIFGLKEQDPDQNASPEERYLKRVEKAKNAPPDGRLSDAGSPTREHAGLFDRPDMRDPLFSPQDQHDPGAFSQMFSGSEASPFARKNTPLAGTKGPAVNLADQPDDDQAADLARFRSLIGEVPGTPKETLTAPHFDTSSAAQPSPAFDAFGHPTDVPALDLSAPGGLTLPSEFMQARTQPRKTKKPSWEPQAPPWLSSDLNPPTAPPVRKFY